MSCAELRTRALEGRPPDAAHCAECRAAERLHGQLRALAEAEPVPPMSEDAVRAIRATLVAIADDAKVDPMSPARAAAVRARLMADVRARRDRGAPRGRTIAWALAFSALGGVAVAAPGAAEQLRAWARPVVEAIVEATSGTPSRAGAGRPAERAALGASESVALEPEAPEAAVEAPREDAPIDEAPQGTPAEVVEAPMAEEAPRASPEPAARRVSIEPAAPRARRADGVAIPRPESSDHDDPLRAETEAEATFRAGWAAFARGAYDDAAERLARAIALDPTAPLAEDAAYTRAVAFARAARRDDAIAAFGAYLGAHPSGARVDEARVALGELLVEGGHVDEARPHLEAAQGSALEPVRRRAARALERLARP